MIWLLIALMQTPGAAEPPGAPRADYVFVHADAGDQLAVFVDAGTVQRPAEDGSVYGYTLIAGPGMDEDGGPVLLTTQADCRGGRLRFVSGRSLAGVTRDGLGEGFTNVAGDEGATSVHGQLCAGQNVAAGARRFGSAEAAAAAAPALVTQAAR